MAGRGQAVLFCQTRNCGRRLAYDLNSTCHQCPGRGKDCRFAEQPDGSLERFGSDCGRLPQSNRGS